LLIYGSKFEKGRLNGSTSILPTSLIPQTHVRTHTCTYVHCCLISGNMKYINKQPYPQIENGVHRKNNQKKPPT